VRLYFTYDRCTTDEPTKGETVDTICQGSPELNRKFNNTS